MKFKDISEPQSVIEQLHSFYLFNHVSHERLGVMIEKAQLVTLEKDEFIFKRGESYHRGVYVILNGNAELYTDSGSSIQMVYGDILGLTTFLGKSNYYVTAKADDGCELVFLPEICI